ncbi:MAG: type I DNA topoisomerase [Mycobacteriales bacterium]
MSTPSKRATAPARRRRSAGARSGGHQLVIVESPAKAKTIASYLGDGFVVESSIGHIRDLPRNAADIPAKYKGEPWSRLGVDVDHGFVPLYVISPDRRQQVSRLKALLKDADELFLATDGDREGEAIAWHLIETLKPSVPVRRMVFHEITPQAIRDAVANPRELDSALVDAQETRRILDRLYGYEVSPVLWKKVMPKLSAGRVQSVFTRLVVDRERARMRFVAASYWDVEGEFATGRGATDTEPASLVATLVSLDGRRLATGRDFEPDTGQVRGDVLQLDEASARRVAEVLTDKTFRVSRVDERPYTRRPYAPFITSTLQQESGRKLRFSAQRAMRTAQRLYENGYITYMRTDSTNLSATAISAARTQARELYGADYVPDQPRHYSRKVKNAQEAHEAIRPAGDSFRTPGQVADELSADEFRVYELIWQRTIASQMADARGTSVSVRLLSDAAVDELGTAEFGASGKTITFPGFLRAYVEHTDDETAEREDAERRLPRVGEGNALTGTKMRPDGHQTTPPARYTEASLVKALEELGIGRPSTYAAHLENIQDRGYVWKKGNALVPAWVAFAVVGLLESYFGRLVDYDFTAAMEDDLDTIAAGDLAGVEWLSRFYFGSDDGQEGGLARSGGLKKLVGERLEEIDARGVNSIPLRDGKTVVRVGRYGPYLQRGGDDGDRASLPDDLAPDELTPEKIEELLDAPSGDRMLGVDPDTGYDVVAKNGRYGPYVTLALPEGSKDKPPTSSLFESMSLDTVTLDDALKLLSLPRTVGTDAAGEPVTAQNGRYGPYIKRGADSRSLGSEDELFTVTLEQAEALLAQPKTRGRRAAAAPPLRDLGTDPATAKTMVIKDGRFGPYVTDGETNASLRKGEEVESITPERGSELLAERRARGPARPKKRAARKAAPRAKKATAKS